MTANDSVVSPSAITSTSEGASAPSLSPAPAVEAPAAAVETPAVATETPAAENILGDTVSPAEVKKTEAPAEGAKADTVKAPETEKKTEVAPETKTEEVKLEPTYDFKFPETVQLDAEPVKEFTKIIAEIESGKLDHDALQAKGQTLVDMHIKGVQETVTKLTDSLVNFHEQQKQEWFDKFKTDPELGGTEERLKETVSALRTAVETYAGNEAQVAEFRQVMKETGVGNHPAVIRMLKNMDAKIRKYETETDNGNGGTNRIVVAQKPAPTKVKPYQQFYTSA